MLGAIIGDIAGSRFEFSNTFDYDFEMFHKGCEYTDDTICTVAIADAILSGECDYKHKLVEWCKRYPNPMGGYGGRFAGWISNPVPYGSWGNGAAMRVSPVGWLFDNDKQIKEEAAKTAMISHSHREGVKGAVYIALAIYYLRTIGSKKPIEKILYEFYSKEELLYIPKRGEWCDSCQGCVPLSFNIFLQSDSFSDAIRRAVSYGGDSDTIGAIVGSLAEAYYGIPEGFRKKALTYLPKDMKEVISKFYERIRK